MNKVRTTVKGHGGFFVRSWRDLGRQGYGNGGTADTPWTRQGIFTATVPRQADYGGPGLPLSRRHIVENPGLKRAHAFIEVNGLCLTCNMLHEGHELLMIRIRAMGEKR